MQPQTSEDKALTLLGKLYGEIEPGASTKGLIDSTTPQDHDAMQALTTAYITTMYFSALSNLSLQRYLPDDPAKLDEEMPRFKIVFNRTYADYTTAANWLAKNGGEFIQTSPAKQYYDELLGMEDVIVDLPGTIKASEA
jgi:hypothetical protein